VVSAFCTFRDHGTSLCIFLVVGVVPGFGQLLKRHQPSSPDRCAPGALGDHHILLRHRLDEGVLRFSLAVFVDAAGLHSQRG